MSYSEQNNMLFWRNHLFIPLACFLLLAGLFEYSNTDLIVADWIYQAEGGHWALKHNFILSTILHDSVAFALKTLALVLIGLAIASHRVQRLKPYRRALWYIAVAMPVSALLASVGKNLTHVDCPWDLIRYGGDKPYIRLLEPYVEPFKYGKCFPAGHASGGYAFVALYFLFYHFKPSWRLYGLGIGLAAGVLLGVTQQLRGAHFLSHDLWTLAFCWCNSLAWYKIILGKV